jgi:hypothetical protein
MKCPGFADQMRPTAQPFGENAVNAEAVRHDKVIEEIPQ